MYGQPCFVALSVFTDYWMLQLQRPAFDDHWKEASSYLVTTPRHVRQQRRGTAPSRDALQRGLAGKINQDSLCCN
jgi:hypothetical protein